MRLNLMEVLLSEVQQELISDICISERHNQSVMELWKKREIELYSNRGKD